MGKLTCLITDKNGAPIEGALAALKNERFEDVYSSVTDASGRCVIEAEGSWPFFFAVKDYGERFLEYWCQNVDLSGDVTINALVDKLEIYGLHVFEVKGAYPAVTAYFRPMSLAKVQAGFGPNELAPQLGSFDDIKVSINGESVKILSVNIVKEYAEEHGNAEFAGFMTAYLIQTSLPDKILETGKNFFELTLTDEEGNCGAASLFYSDFSRK